eukprot:TRINITY_DN13272_c0_g1_i1.p2 TRINITY_DN13272_c0_g1~~TRINITY_DN13272_c0_g1_i1.p2  ORF type:complete len:182 (+),score=48.68 TRINITY_DN13272_c0_g1_i1:312-857(+)
MKFKKELSKDTGELAREIAIKKKQMAEERKKEKDQNLHRISTFKQSSEKLNLEKRERVQNIEREMKESIKKCISSKAEQIRTAQQVEYANFLKKLKERDRDLAKLESVEYEWKKRINETANSTPFLMAEDRMLKASMNGSIDLSVSKSPLQKRFSGQTIVNILSSLNSTKDMHISMKKNSY